MADRLIKEGFGIARGAFGGPRHQGQRIVGNFGPFRIGNSAQEGDHYLGLDSAQVKPLTARQHGHGNLADFGGGKDEFDVLGRFFQRLEQRVEGAGAQHVDFVNDIDLVAGRGRSVVDAVQNVGTDVVDPGLGGAIHLDHVHMLAGGNRLAGIALAARLGGWPALAIRTGAVQPFGDDSRGGGLAGAANAGHDEGLRDPVRGKGVLEGAHHGLLADQIRKRFGAVFACQNLIAGGGCVGHGILEKFGLSQVTV